MEPTGAWLIKKSPSSVVSEVVARPLGDTVQPVDTPMPTQRCRAIQIVPYSLDSKANPLPTAWHTTHNPVPERHPQRGPETTILVVEDDPDISMALQDLLEFEGFAVECVATCRQAFSSIEQRTYHAVLLDLGLPDGDGRSVLKRLQDFQPTVPVIVLSATNRDLGLLHPFARLTKPWQRDELCALLHRAIGTVSKKA